MTVNATRRAGQHVDFLVRDLERAQNKARLYEKQLMREAVMKADREGVPIAYYTLRIVRPDDHTIYVYRDDRGNIDPTHLLEFVREDFPVLYRKHERAKMMYEQALAQLP